MKETDDDHENATDNTIDQGTLTVILSDHVAHDATNNQKQAIQRNVSSYNLVVLHTAIMQLHVRHATAQCDVHVQPGRDYAWQRRTSSFSLSATRR